MSSSPNKQKYIVLNPRPEHFKKIQDLCVRVYPFSKPWNLDQLESHRSYFPDGQLIVLEKSSGRVVGLAFSLIVSWDDYLSQDSWKDFTASGYFHNHNPARGKTLYGAEVMVDPEMRGRGIGKMLYEGRKKIVEKYNLRRIRAGARLRGYAKFADKLTPDAYVRQVVEKKIYDPTLSFQLSQDFKVIDVAPNYLFNDPESLGHAAVIEWLNPKVAIARDYDKQARTTKAVMSGENFVAEFLPRELRRIVRKATFALGNVVREYEGDSLYSRIEFYREQLKKTRNAKNREHLLFLLDELKKERPEDRLKIAHAFSLQLELVNVCEAAYRTWRQRLKPVTQGLKSKLPMTYVLTAHPTESRPKATVEILASLGKLILDGIQSDFMFNETELLSKTRMLWLHAFTKSERPTVADEAEYIYSLIFSEDIFDFILADKPSYSINLRTWVGGDKDGNPFVNKDVMRDCFVRSRKYLLAALRRKIKLMVADAAILEGSAGVQRSVVKGLAKLAVDLDKFESITAADGTRLKTWIMKYKRLMSGAGVFLRKHDQSALIERMLEIFPALVFAIELREDAELVKRGLKDPDSAIRGMLAELSSISGALGITSYAKGFVISRCESADDITHACRLIQSICQRRNLPVIPLFESRDALVLAPKIVRAWLGVKANHEIVTRHWSRNFEVMLGYSDSAKQAGALPSRYLIKRAMVGVEKAVLSFDLKPRFFHGSGGSVARGGGSLKEQIAWWSNSAVNHPKLTIQGEMIQRQFATREILNSQCIHLATEARKRKIRAVKASPSPALDSFVARVGQSYKKLVGDPELLKKLLDASPYRYLDVLKMGSRPSKRPEGPLSTESLRAIPWVLCWTQTRVLMMNWWGVGSAWRELAPKDRLALQEQFDTNPFFLSFVKMLGFTLAKVELEIWELYFTGNGNRELFARFDREYKDAVRFVHEVSRQKDLIWYRMWLQESIRLRSSNIHLLNLLQVLALRDSDERLLKETVVGIACGMLTTG